MIDAKDPQVAHLLKTINYVWQYIGSDLLSSCEEVGHYVDNEEAIECCLDADRLATLGNQQAQDIYDSLKDQYGRKKVFSFLTKSLYLN